MITVPRSIVSKTPYVGPIVSTVGLGFDVKDIFESTTPIGAAKIIGGRILKECTPPELLIGGKFIMFAGGLIATYATGGNPIILSGTISDARSLVRNS